MGFGEIGRGIELYKLAGILMHKNDNMANILQNPLTFGFH